jgi:hypothetical protein
MLRIEVEIECAFCPTEEWRIFLRTFDLFDDTEHKDVYVSSLSKSATFQAAVAPLFGTLGFA